MALPTTLNTIIEDDTTKLEIVEGISKKDKNRTWKALKITIGEWSTLVFPTSRFEMEYIENLVNDKA